MWHSSGVGLMTRLSTAKAIDCRVDRKSKKMQSPVPSPPVAPSAKWAEEEVDFYPKWNLFKALGDFHEEKSRVDDLGIAEDDDSTSDQELLLQGYLNGVAYLCDVEKGGNTVTATGLDKKGVLYIATNNGTKFGCARVHYMGSHY